MVVSRRTFSKMTGATALGAALSSKSAKLSMAQQDDRPTLRFAANAADLGNLDPHFAVTYQDRTVVDMVFNALIRFTPGSATAFEPDIASELPVPEENDDGSQSWTISLRDDVLCHPTGTTDAYLLTSDDVLFSLGKAANPDMSSFAGDYGGWQFSAPDDHTVVITLPNPVSETLFLTKIANYSGGYIVPRLSYEAIGADGFITNPAGTGPFIFESHTPQNNLIVVANDDYFRDAPLLGAVEIRYIADVTSRELALQSGDIDVAVGLPDQAWVDRINETDNLTADVFGVGEVVILNLDTQHEILKDRKVREAIFCAISRDNHVGIFGSPVAEPCYSIVPDAFMPGGLTKEEAIEAGVEFPQDLDWSRELLAEAGYPDGFELSLVSSENPLYLGPYQVLAEELRQVGIMVSLEVTTHAAYHDLIRQERNAIVVYLAYRPTADIFLTHFFASDSGVTNFAHFTVDDLRDQARAETDPDTQAELWQQANIDIMSNLAGTGLIYVNLVYARANTVDYGHELVAQPQLYPGINETTSITTER